MSVLSWDLGHEANGRDLLYDYFICGSQSGVFVYNIVLLDFCCVKCAPYHVYNTFLSFKNN